MSIFQANIRAKKQEEFRQKLQEKPAAPAQETAPTGNKYFDYRVKQESQARGKRHFKFYEKGRFEKIAEKMRKKVRRSGMRFRMLIFYFSRF